MSEEKINWYSLPQLQKRIVLCLAKEGMQTRNEVKRKLGSAYKNVLFSFKSLEKRGIIRQMQTKKYRNREFPIYWLTEMGALVALLHGAPKEKLLENVLQLYPNNEILQCTIEMSEYLNPEVFKIGTSAIIGKRKLDIADLMAIITVQMQTDSNMKKLRKALETLKKYPTTHTAFKKMLSQISKIEQYV